VDAVAATTDGFELATIDLELRSEGDVLGDRQSGRRSGLTLVRVTKDGELIDRARRYATELVSADPLLGGHPDLALDISRRLDEASADYLAKN
jgi:ATP-dependent DNA helicase RecG